MNQFLQAMGQQ
jgi:hypothetical protein